MAAQRPGGALSNRPLHFYWIADCSGSMSVDGKIQALNTAIREALPHMRKVADENPNADVMIRSLRFSHGASWQAPKAESLDTFCWTDLIADPLPPKQSVSADVIFLMDTSGSMGDEIESVKQSCQAFAKEITKRGASVRLGLIGFDIGGHRDRPKGYTVHSLSSYTIGIWPLTSPPDFQKNIASLSLGLFGGGGCYLANSDTVDIFPHVRRAFGAETKNARILVVISDEIGSDEGLDSIISELKKASITVHVLGVHGESRAHEKLARRTGGEFWDIGSCHGVHDFSGLLGTVAETIGEEVTNQMPDGTLSQGTDMGAAMKLLAKEFDIPPMPNRALPPVLVLVSDGRPSDNFASGLTELMAKPWGKKAVRIAIAIGSDADENCLKQFIGHSELAPLKSNSPESLITFIKWASTAVLKAASAPSSQPTNSEALNLNIPVPTPPDITGNKAEEDNVW